KIPTPRPSFLPTPSARRATKGLSTSTVWPSNFYPRPPRGGRQYTFCFASNHPDFYPRPPRGGRHRAQVNHWNDQLFLPTPSARRATEKALEECGLVAISTHALREEGDVQPQSIARKGGNFYPRPPRGGRHQGR